MPSALRQWRQDRRDSEYWQKARSRSAVMAEAEILAQIELTLMQAGQAVSRYRRASDRDHQLDQLRELRLALEASLGMLENTGLG